MDRFCDAMIAIRKEIETATKDQPNNPLKNAPHTQEMLTKDIWEFPYRVREINKTRLQNFIGGKYREF